jgi:hypothetical protein
MHIAIDSSHKLTYTGVISASSTEMYNLFQKIERMFNENGVAGKYHWSQLSNKTRNKLKRPLLKAISESRVNFNVLNHTKPRTITKKDWFMFYLPTQIAQRLEHGLAGREGAVDLVVDNDYNIGEGGAGTDYFIERVLRQLGVRLTGKEHTVRREKGILKMTIKQANGNILSFYASVAEKESKEKNMVDIYLGLYISDPKAFEKMKNVYFKELK